MYASPVIRHTPEEFLDGNKKAVRRNKLITGVLYYSKDMETFATGLKRIKDLCDEAGCKVEFRDEVDDFVVIFYRNLRETWKSNLDGTNHVTNQATIQDDVKNGEITLGAKTLEFCMIPRTRQEIQDHLGLKNRGYLRQAVLQPLLESEKLEMTIPDKPNSKNQKYVTVKKARNVHQ